MSVEYTQRFVTGDFAYAEIRAETFEEFVEASANLTDHLGESAAVATVKKAFGKTTEVASGSGGFKKPASGGFGNKGKQQAAEDDRFLGKHDGYGITVKPGKWGFYFNAYNADTKDRVNVNLAEGQDPASVSLQDAIDALSAA